MQSINNQDKVGSQVPSLMCYIEMSSTISDEEGLSHDHHEEGYDEVKIEMYSGKQTYFK